MSNTIEYRGYVGSVEFSEEDGLFYGRLLGISSLVLFDGPDYERLVQDFHEAVDHYIDTCV